MINTLQEPWLSGGYSGYILLWGPYRQDYPSSRQLALFFKLNQHQENKSRHQRASEYCQNHAFLCFSSNIPATRDTRDSGVSTFMGLLQVYWDGQDLQATGGHRSQRFITHSSWLSTHSKRWVWDIPKCHTTPCYLEDHPSDQAWFVRPLGVSRLIFRHLLVG